MPYYTWAQEMNNRPCRVSVQPETPIFEIDNLNPGDAYEGTAVVTKEGSIPANLYFVWKMVEGDLKLYQQLDLTIWINDDPLPIYEGKMSNWAYDGRGNTEHSAYFVKYIEVGEEVAFRFRVVLPGPETGNVYQGAAVNIALEFYTKCPSDDDDREDELSPEEPGTEPEEDKKDDSSSIIIRPDDPQAGPPLPRSGGVSAVLLASGLLLILAGVSLKKGYAKKL